jgi:hypothetical protein
MNDAAQIRRCSGTLRAKPLLLQTPDLKISNREPLRLEINVTQKNKRPNLILIGKQKHFFRTGSGLSIVSAIAVESTQPSELLANLHAVTA